VREIRTLRSTWRGLETWHGRDSVTLANERARNSEYKLRPKPARQSSTLPGRGSGWNSLGLLGTGGHAEQVAAAAGSPQKAALLAAGRDFGLGP
jgi:hypothetical protein